MGTLIDFALQYFHLFLIVFLLFLVTFLLSMFFKKRKTLIIVAAVLILGMFIFVEQLKYTTFLELYSDQLNENSKVKSIFITVNRSVPEKSRRLKIEKKETIDRIIGDLSTIELRKDEDIHGYDRDYHVEIIVTNQIEEKHFSTTSVRLYLDKNYLDDYKIVSETNHLDTIETLVEDESLGWKSYD